MSESTSLAWFRRDLRLHDNAALAAACAADRGHVTSPTRRRPRRGGRRRPRGPSRARTR
nr:deoxyribodipyrimidine photo-lyase [Haloferax massiliensis]